MKPQWKCLNEGCTDNTVYRFKGLCRVCTSYDDAGNVVAAVQRQKVNADGSPYHTHTHTHMRRMTREDYTAARRRKPTKKEEAYIRQAFADAHVHEHGEEGHVHGPDCGHDIEPDMQIMEIGESLVSAESEFDTLVGGEEE